MESKAKFDNLFKNMKRRSVRPVEKVFKALIKPFKAIKAFKHQMCNQKLRIPLFLGPFANSISDWPNINANNSGLTNQTKTYFTILKTRGLAFSNELWVVSVQ